MSDCPECDRPLRSGKCSCGWVAPLPFISRVAPPEPPKPYKPPTHQTLERFKSAMKDFGFKKSGPWWTPERVRNAAQVNFIVIQANKYGPMSQQGRFLAQCKEAGVITPDNKLRVRMVGEDEDYGRAA